MDGKEAIYYLEYLRHDVHAKSLYDVALVKAIDALKQDYEAEEDYQRGLNDAWEVTIKVCGYITDGGMSNEELRNAFGTEVLGEIVVLPIGKVMSILTEYEAKKKAEEEIKVGDEVETDYTGNVIIAEKPKDGWYATIAKNFARYSIHESHIIKKTGRHFPQVAELLNAMKEDGET